MIRFRYYAEGAAVGTTHVRSPSGLYTPRASGSRWTDLGSGRASLVFEGFAIGDDGLPLDDDAELGEFLPGLTNDGRPVAFRTAWSQTWRVP